MSRYATDTHAFVWHLQSNPKLSTIAQTIFRDTDAGVHQILVPSIVLVELIYLAERKRIESALVTQAFDLLTAGCINYRVAPLDTQSARMLSEIDAAKVPEMPDRIIAATARRLHVPLITHDRMIAESGAVRVVW